MKFNKIVAFAVMIVMLNAKVTPTFSTINLDRSADYLDNSFIKDRKEILQITRTDFVNFIFDTRKISLCKINQPSMSENWINLLGKLIILGSFSSLSMIGNSVLVERYIKVIFKDILPTFLIVFLSISILSIVSAIAMISFPSSAALTDSSFNDQNGCILK